MPGVFDRFCGDGLRSRRVTGGEFICSNVNESESPP